MYKPTKLIIGFAFLLIGSNLITYGMTRYWTTSVVLKIAGDEAIMFLSKYGFWFGAEGDLRQNDELNDGRRLWARINDAGGMYHSQPQTFPVIGLGVLLAITGALIPFVTKGEALDVELDDEES